MCSLKVSSEIKVPLFLNGKDSGDEIFWIMQVNTCKTYGSLEGCQ
jgi:hypothetical protein